MMHYWGYGPYYSGFSIIGFVFQVFFWWLIIMLIIKLFKWAGGHSCCHGHQFEQTEEESTEKSDNLEIIKTRYAKGEINKKEFDQLKKDLS